MARTALLNFKCLFCVKVYLPKVLFYDPSFDILFIISSSQIDLSLDIPRKLSIYRTLSIYYLLSLCSVSTSVVRKIYLFQIKLIKKNDITHYSVLSQEDQPFLFFITRL